MTRRWLMTSRAATVALAGILATALQLMLGSGACSAQAPGRAPPKTDENRFENPASAAKWMKPAPTPYPASVQVALDDARRACKDAEGGDLIVEPGLVRTDDLTGDGLPDYVVDFRHTHCAEIATLFNGTGGWDLSIFVARKTGEPVRVFQGRALDYDLESGRSQRTIRFRLHGSLCRRVGADLCVKRRRMSDRPFTLESRR